jgi:hypothetical protein
VQTALHARAKAFVAAYESAAEMPETFDALACDLARHQAAHSAGFTRLCRARGVEPASLVHANDIPAVPTDAFKLTRVATFPEAETTVTFRTSGTTQDVRGAHAMRDVSTYDRGAIVFGKHWLARAEERLPIVCLAPPPAQMPDTSLVHMCQRFVEAFGDGRDPTWLIDGDIIDVSGFDERVARALAADQPMLVLATSFALVHFLDALGDDTFRLPQGSRVMQTGGFKGRSREVPAPELRAQVSRMFGVPERAIVAEYGMTELSSQFYERTLYDADAAHGSYAEPPWARVIPVDPETLAPLADGEIGIAKIIDLLNVESAVAVLTQDRVRRVGKHFELLGRLPGAPPRGCSIAIDELLGG